MCCRSESSGQEAAEDIKGKYPEALLEVMQLDLASLASVNRFADQLIKREKKIDILVCNAGVMMTPASSKSADNFELQFATNHLGLYIVEQ